MSRSLLIEPHHYRAAQHAGFEDQREPYRQHRAERRSARSAKPEQFRSIHVTRPVASEREPHHPVMRAPRAGAFSRGSARRRTSQTQFLAHRPGQLGTEPAEGSTTPAIPFTVEFRRLLLETARVHLCPGTRGLTKAGGSPLSVATRQMHLGVFVLGAGNHSAGRRWEGRGRQ